MAMVYRTVSTLVSGRRPYDHWTEEGLVEISMPVETIMTSTPAISVERVHVTIVCKPLQRNLGTGQAAGGQAASCIGWRAVCPGVAYKFS